MINLEETSYGYKIVFEGFAQRDDVARLAQSLGQQLAERDQPFGCLVDLRQSRAIPADAQTDLMQAIGYTTQYGMERCAVAVASAIAKIQAMRIAKETGIYETTRFIDASADGRWEKSALDWIEKGKDPDA
jgi:hypothetical protein